MRVFLAQDLLVIGQRLLGIANGVIVSRQRIGDLPAPVPILPLVGGKLCGLFGLLVSRGVVEAGVIFFRAQIGGLGQLLLVLGQLCLAPLTEPRQNLVIAGRIVFREHLFGTGQNLFKVWVALVALTKRFYLFA